MQQHFLEAYNQREEEHELDHIVNLCLKVSRQIPRRNEATDPCCVMRTALIRVVHIVQLVNLGEDDDPANPCASSIEHGLDGVLDAVVKFELCLEFFADMPPDHSNQVPRHNGDDVYDEGQVPRYRQVRTSPEEPSLDVVLDVPPVLVWMGLIPVEVDEEGGGYDNAREKSRADERAKQKTEEPAKSSCQLSSLWQGVCAYAGTASNGCHTPFETPAVLLRSPHGLLELGLLVDQVLLTTPIIMVIVIVSVRNRG